MANSQSETNSDTPQGAEDPCIAVCRDFIAKHVAMEACPEPDIPTDIGDAASEAWLRVREQRPVTVAGFAAQLMSATIWIGETEFGDPDIQAIFRAVKGLCDLVGFDAGQALEEPQSIPELRSVPSDYHSGRYRDYLAAMREWATMPDNVHEEVAHDLNGKVDDIADDLMTGPASSFHAVMLKARTAHHQMMMVAQASTISPTEAADMFAIIAADLEVLTAGKAVRP